VRCADRGSATVWVLAVCLLTWSGTTAALSIGAAVVTRHRAESAADLAALAGARAAADGAGDPCAAANRVAEAMRARVAACDLLGDGSVQVVTVIALPGLLAQWRGLPPARARSRAGHFRGS
jgi:secretion/DNA translocation related TadE-like protein